MAVSVDLAPDAIKDVIIIGAGPCGLAVASRLCEHTPSAIFTDDEHQRYNWIRKHARHMSIKNWRDGTIKKAQKSRASCKYSILTLDGSGDQWMGRWDTLFKKFDIKHLRSPMFFHVDPGDRDGLLAFAYEEGCENELVEIRGCVGKEISKHQKKKKRASGNAHTRIIVEERDRKDYQTPSTSIFLKHCSSLIDRYSLHDNSLVQQATVSDITYGTILDVPLGMTKAEDLFTITTPTGTLYARTVVLAIGPGNAPSLPIPKSLSTTTLPNSSHSMQITTLPSPNIASKIRNSKPTTALVIGGGLTSAQISDLLLRRGVTHVHHLMRGPLKTKPFDIDLAWMGKYRNISQAYFYGAESDAERWEQIRNARGGGSITPLFAKVLKNWEAKGKLSIHTHTTLDLERSVFMESKNAWDVRTTPEIPALEGVGVDYIYFCTGIQTDVNAIPCLQSMLRDYPIETEGGLPCLTDDLMWKDDVPLFVTGRLAGLRLGPAAPNLGGARAGAERVAWGLEDWLGKRVRANGEAVSSEGVGGEEDAGEGGTGGTGGTVKEKVRRDSAQDRDEYATARGNRFDALEYAGLGDE